MNASGELPPLAATEANDDGMTTKERERLVRKALKYCKKWDRSAKLKVTDGRKGWERHLVGILCQVSKSRIYSRQGHPDVKTM